MVKLTSHGDWIPLGMNETLLLWIREICSGDSVSTSSLLGSCQLDEGASIRVRQPGSGGKGWSEDVGVVLSLLGLHLQLRAGTCLKVKKADGLYSIKGPVA